MEKSYKEHLNDITTFILDVDGVLTNGTVLVTSEGALLRSMNIKDGFALKTAVDKGYKVCIISGGSNEGVRKRLAGLGVTEIHLGTHKKLEKLNEILNKYNLETKSVLYMGDDIPDIEVMNEAGLPCSPQDAAPEVKAASLYVSHKNGGQGAVRDVIEQVLKVQGNWVATSDAKFD